MAAREHDFGEISFPPSGTRSVCVPRTSRRCCPERQSRSAAGGNGEGSPESVRALSAGLWLV